MAGRDSAVRSGRDLEERVIEVAHGLGLDAYQQVTVGRRIWGAERRIDVLLRHPDNKQSLGVECKYQGSSGSAEEKIPATVQDIAAWPIPGIVVFAGEGFSDNMRSYLYSTGKAVDLADVAMWLQLFFGLDL